MHRVALSCGLLSVAVASAGCGASPSARGARVDPLPPAPDYADPLCWAALPERADAADAVPLGEVDGQATARVDVFFVHPTTHLGAAWNAAYDEPEPARALDEVILPHDAAAFNAAGRVYVPRYRQASLWAFFPDDDVRAERAARALDVAYSDVLRAFDAWAARSDRPVIVAAHSQGSYHALRLLRDRFEGDDAMRARLVAAYLVGVPLPLDVLARDVPSIPLCAADAPRAGCLLTWNTVLLGARPPRLAGRVPLGRGGDGERWLVNGVRARACTRPISSLASADGDGATAGEWSPLEAHLGAVLFFDDAAAVESPAVEPALTRARCVDGVLEVEPSVPLRYRRDPLGRDGDLHAVDYALFFLDVRRDALRRATAWAARP